MQKVKTFPLGPLKNEAHTRTRTSGGLHLSQAGRSSIMVLMMGGMNKAIGGSAASIRFSPRAINNHRTDGSSTINTYTPIKTGLKTRSRKRHVHTQIGLFPSHRPDQADRISHVKYPVVMVEDVRPYKDHTLVRKTNGEYLLLPS